MIKTLICINVICKECRNSNYVNLIIEKFEIKWIATFKRKVITGDSWICLVKFTTHLCILLKELHNNFNVYKTFSNSSFGFYLHYFTMWGINVYHAMYTYSIKQ